MKAQTWFVFEHSVSYVDPKFDEIWNFRRHISGWKNEAGEGDGGLFFHSEVF